LITATLFNRRESTWQQTVRVPAAAVRLVLMAKNDLSGKVSKMWLLSDLDFGVPFGPATYQWNSLGKAWPSKIKDFRQSVKSFYHDALKMASKKCDPSWPERCVFCEHLPWDTFLCQESVWRTSWVTSSAKRRKVVVRHPCELSLSQLSNRGKFQSRKLLSLSQVFICPLKQPRNSCSIFGIFTLLSDIKKPLVLRPPSANDLFPVNSVDIVAIAANEDFTRCLLEFPTK